MTICWQITANDQGEQVNLQPGMPSQQAGSPRTHPRACIPGGGWEISDDDKAC